MTILEQLKKRGIAETISDVELGKTLENEMVSFYTGYDPTAKSLQIGNLFAIITMRRLQILGHKPVVLVGGATGMIGDPSGRNSERNLLDIELVQENANAIKKQLEKLIDFENGKNAAIMVNNYDWLAKINFLEFLREIGRRFRVTEMLAKESVKRRIDAEDGVSYTEFTYQILQAYDYLYLYQNNNVQLQCGGGDQWGNITAGIDLVRKVLGKKVYGMVIPLVTDAQGRKFGKSLGGAIYLDPNISTPYQMYQFLINAEDSCVINYLKYYTFLTLEEIEQINVELQKNPEKRQAQKILAQEVVKYVHGENELKIAEQASKILFGEEIKNISENELNKIFADVPSKELEKSRLDNGINVVEILALTNLWKGKNDVKRSIEQKGAYINNIPVTSADENITIKNLATENTLVVRKGKKNYALIKFVS